MQCLELRPVRRILERHLQCAATMPSSAASALATTAGDVGAAPSRSSSQRAPSAPATGRIGPREARDRGRARARSRRTPPPGAPARARFAEPEQRKRIVAHDRERAREARFGGPMISALEQQVAEIRAGLGQRGIERQRRFELRDRALGLSEASIGDRQVAAYRRIARVSVHRANQRRQRALGIPDLQSQNADRVQRLGIRWQAREERLEARFGARARSPASSASNAPGDDVLDRLRPTGGLRGEPSLFSPIDLRQPHRLREGADPRATAPSRHRFRPRRWRDGSRARDSGAHRVS